MDRSNFIVHEDDGDVLYKFFVTSQSLFDPTTGAFASYDKTNKFGNKQKVIPIKDSYGKLSNAFGQEMTSDDNHLENLDNSEFNRRRITAGAAARIYEKANEQEGSKVKKVVYLPIQVKLNINILPEKPEMYLHAPQYIRQVQVCPKWEIAIDDRVRNLGDQFIKISQQQRNPTSRQEALNKVLLAECDRTSDYIGDKSRGDILSAKLFLTKFLGVPLDEIKKYGAKIFHDKCPVFNNSIWTKFIHVYDLPLDKIKNLNALEILALDHMQGDFEKVKDFVWQDGDDINEPRDNRTSNYMQGLALTNKLIHIGRMKTKATDYGWDLLDKISQDTELLREMQNQLLTANSKAVEPLAEFVRKSLFTAQLFDDLVRENSPGFTGPSTATLLVSKLMRNDTNTFQDFKSLKSWNNFYSIYKYVRPAALIDQNNMPVRYLISKDKQALQMAKDKAYEALARLKDLRPHTFENLLYEDTNNPGRSSWIPVNMEFDDPRRSKGCPDSLSELYARGKVSKQEYDFAKEFFRSYGETGGNGIDELSDYADIPFIVESRQS